MARDHSVARLFVEYSLLDLPTEETPLSLPKPPQGKNINYNYSKGEAARPGRTPRPPAPRSSWGVCGAEDPSVGRAATVTGGL